MESSEITECEFPLDQLPMLVIGAISQYLSNSDVAACCAVSRGVREAFDNHLVWGSRYDKERVKYLQKTPCKVQPGFVHPVTDQSGLSPISEWRLAFMMENHLLNNWRQGKFIDEEITMKIRSSPSQRRWHNCSEYHKFLTSDYVIAAFQSVIEILDVRNCPATNAVNPIPITLRSTSNVVEANDMLLVLYNKGVEAYQLDFSTKQWNIKHAFVMDEPEKLSDDKKDLVKKMIDQKDSTALFVVVDYFFIGYLKGGTSMHIWNFKTGVKLKKEQFPIKNCTIEEIKSSNTNLVLVVKQQKNNSSSTSTFLAYDLLNLAFLPFKETTQSHYEYCVFGNHVSIWAENKLHIYNYQNNKLIVSNYPLETYQMQILGNSIAFLEQNVLRIFNIGTGNIQILMRNVSWFEVLNRQFIQIQFFRRVKQQQGEEQQGEEQEMWPYEQEQEIWSCKNIFEVITPNTLRKTSLSLGFRGCGYYLNKHATRYIVRYADGHVLHFW